MTEHVLTREFQIETIDQPRRRFFGNAVMTIATAQLGVIASAIAQTDNAASKVPAIKPGTNTSFNTVKQINAGLLNVGYAEDGPSDGNPCCCCTVGRTTYTALSMLRRCSRPGATASSCRIFAATARRASLHPTRSAMASSP